MYVMSGLSKIRFLDPESKDMNPYQKRENNINHDFVQKNFLNKEYIMEGYQDSSKISSKLSSINEENNMIELTLLNLVLKVGLNTSHNKLEEGCPAYLQLLTSKVYI